MTEDLKHIEQIEQYCEGKMSLEEKSAFEAKLFIDEDLKDELELYKTIVSSFKSTKEESVRTKLKEIDAELDKGFNLNTNRSSTTIKNKNYFAIAASVTIIIGLISYFMFFYTSKDKLIASFEVEEPGLPVLMGSSSNVIFDDGMSTYKQNDFQSSLPIFENLLKDNPASDTLNYFVGIILSRMNKHNEAMPFFETVVMNSNSSFQSKASYYLGLCYWKTNDMFKAKEIFKQISQDSSSPFSEKATEILKHF